MDELPGSEIYNKSWLFASGSIHDLPRAVFVAIAEGCRIAPGAPIGGGTVPHAASDATAGQKLNV
jgi:hypothetical protein